MTIPLSSDESSHREGWLHGPSWRTRADEDVQGISFSLIIFRVGIDLSSRPLLPAWLLSPRDHHRVTTLPVMVTTLASPAYPSDRRESESREAIPHVAVPAPLAVTSPCRKQASSETSTDADWDDPLGGKSGDQCTPE